MPSATIDEEQTITDGEKPTVKEGERSNDKPEVGGGEVIDVPETTIVENNDRKNKLAIGIAVLSAVLLVIVNHFFGLGTNQCMQWQDDHYEAVDCRQTTTFSSPIVALDEKLLQFRQLRPKKDDPFFKDGQPVIWYAKTDHKVDFFNADGKHPVTGKNLGPVTFYIMQKYGE